MRRRELFRLAIASTFLGKIRFAQSASLKTASPVLAGLTPAQHERALRLHQESVVINCHDHMWRRQDYLDMLKGGVTANIYKPLADGIYFDERNRRIFPASPEQRLRGRHDPPPTEERGRRISPADLFDSFDWTGKYLEMVAKVEAREKAGDPPVLIVRKVEDIHRAKREGKAGIILGNEGSLPLGENLEMFDPLYRKGLRELALFWPAGYHTRHVLDEKGTLTPWAHQVIEKANKVGVVLDPSHLAHVPAFRQVLEESKPVIHTHGAPKFPRNRRFSEGDLEDDQIRAIADQGGVIGLHFCTYIKNVKGHYWSPTLDDLMDHVEHLVKVGGIGCVGIGADHFPYNSQPVGDSFEQEGSTPRIEDRDWRKTFVVGLDKISGMPLFTQGLVGRGFSDGDIKKILGGNVLRVLKQVWKA